VAATPSLRVPVFPLNVVLFPGGTLPLRIFEQRYLEMTKACLRDGSPFGVCLINEGREVGTPAVPSEVGCLARIEQWDMPQLGIFHLVTRGTQRFRLMRTETQPDGLMLGDVALLEPEPRMPVEARHARCVAILRELVTRFGDEHFPPPHAFDDASWIGYRLAEILPIDRFEKQRMLVSNDATGRLDRILQLLRRG
jgi:Lon protease-like protein